MHDERVTSLDVMPDESPIRPLFDRVVLELDDKEQKSAGGIYLAEDAQKKPSTGTVIAVGPGKHDHGVFVPTTLTVGLRVKFGQWAGQEVEMHGRKLFVLHEEEVLGVVV